MGTIAAMLVTLVSVISESPPVNCLVKAVSAFTVFAGLGMIVRYVFLTLDEEREQAKKEKEAEEAALAEIAPGTPVSELLPDEEPLLAPETAIETEEPTPVP